ncbi:tRNAHis guanylyltransferase [Emericellopsis cladophorae]|uniref:tRNA(His) guanylyltransferase n=1 Tax=Emericellopsis cladophorae TaxID=2686198 RepID=A0A9Q0BFX3_9HYPO|nr:tRNAHis guanylyltransferase [Emericellopsis cladophorae]KAI6783080.1 tRNAHis guanylyltransferase [Emericellopsis cladophorae]
MANSRMCAKYRFEKPNDRRALDLMNTAAKAVIADLPEITLAYGVSDEYSKLVSTVVSTFTSNYVYSWSSHFPDTPLSFPLPTFDGRAVVYPTVQNLRDYLSWRQADCHINNLYNTAFWSLIQLGGMENKEAEQALAGTLAADKNEILFSKFGINYNREPEIFKKGSVIFRDYELVEPASHNTAETVDAQAEPVQQSKKQTENDKRRRSKAAIMVDHLDIIKDEFWDRRPWILSNKPGKIPKEV